MNLVIDIGNTQYKVCIFRNQEIVYHEYVDQFNSNYLRKLKDKFELHKAIYSDTRGVDKQLFEGMFGNSMPIMELETTTDLPILIDYETPETLGKDRIAGVVGASVQFPEQHCLVVDIGTALTIDFIDEKGVFKGGIISPGPNLRFKALHHFTGKLPLFEPTDNVGEIGHSTQTAIQYGVQNGVAYEINAYISRFKQQYNNLKILVTGGYAHLFDKKINYPIFADSFLVPKGLNRILEYNELQK